MIHIWLPTQHAALRLWQQTTQTWQTADDWQTLATLANLQTTQSAKLQACLYFPSVNLLTIQPTLTASQLNALGDTGSGKVVKRFSPIPNGRSPKARKWTGPPV